MYCSQPLEGTRYISDTFFHKVTLLDIKILKGKLSSGFEIKYNLFLCFLDNPFICDFFPHVWRNFFIFVQIHLLDFFYWSWSSVIIPLFSVNSVISTCDLSPYNSFSDVIISHIITSQVQVEDYFSVALQSGSWCENVTFSASF